MKSFRVKYELHFDAFITVKARNMAEAIENAKQVLTRTYGIEKMKKIWIKEVVEVK